MRNSVAETETSQMKAPATSMVAIAEATAAREGAPSFRRLRASHAEGARTSANTGPKNKTSARVPARNVGVKA
jgi:hypothetical protein